MRLLGYGGQQKTWSNGRAGKIGGPTPRGTTQPRRGGKGSRVRFGGVIVVQTHHIEEEKGMDTKGIDINAATKNWSFSHSVLNKGEEVRPMNRRGRGPA